VNFKNQSVHSLHLVGNRLATATLPDAPAAAKNLCQVRSRFTPAKRSEPLAPTSRLEGCFDFFKSNMADPVESVTVEKETEDKDRVEDDGKDEGTEDNDAMEERSESGSEASSSSGATTPSGPNGIF
jgi:hypothetical protein